MIAADFARPSRRAFLTGTASGAIALAAAQPAGAQALAAASTPADIPALAAQPFDMADVALHEGPFLHAQRMTERYLLSLSPDRMLHNFRVNAGLEPKAPVYGGWESEPTWADINCHGHTLGHYLSACALAYRATGTPDYRERIDYIASELAACQEAAGSGLVTAFPQGAALVAAHIAGEPITGVPWYTLHKVYAGLRDGAELAGSETAREVLLRLADWGVVATRDLTDAQFEAMLATEHGGMNEIYADLYAMTGKPEYRALAESFSHKALLVPLTREHDHLDGLHANTQVPKVVGFERVAQIGADEGYHAAAEFFWQTVTRTRSYATGGHGDNEHFFAMADVADHVFSAKGSETCCQHNMAKLTRALFLTQPRADYADFYERTLFNGILASQDPDSGMATYFQGARPGYMKLYHTPEDSFWCCTGTGMENHVKYRDSIYFHAGNTLWVNLLIPSSVQWHEHGAALTQDTRFPEEPATRLTWTLDQPKELTLKLRHPGWSPTARVIVNGEPVIASDQPGRYLDVAQRWRDGDTVELVLEMAVTAEPLAAAPHIAAFTYGPLVLAAELGEEALPPGADIVINERKYGQYNDAPVQVPRLTGSPEDVAGRIAPAAGGAPLTFAVKATDGSEVTLVPYHRIAHQRYATYWDLSPHTA
ncbi:glycoside hydrolase family 127 protein [Aurantiacibacter suaedae]|uniref:glycoside hydrolase family 127 protein n=1 Tax=Aurantiacibacter suaedae TaxID=2545755 RepID=UPI0010F8C815|nr:glycoside hydrolase family 127 protein [Aurantiacibacter suaedae]